MPFRRYVIVCFIALLSVSAQSQSELQKLAADTAFAKNLISESQQELDKYQGKLNDLRQQGVVAQQTLSQSKSELNKVEAVYESDPSPANKRALDRAQSAVVLAERKVSSLEKRMSFSSRRVEELQTQITDAEAKVSANASREEQLKEEIQVQRVAKQEAEKRAAQLAQERSILQQTQQEEFARLTKEREEAAQAAAKKREAEKMAAEKAKAVPQVSAKDKAEYERVNAVVSEFDAYIASGVRQRAEYSRLVGYSSSNGKFSLEHIGGELYVGEANLDGGEHRVSVRANTYRVLVAEENAGDTFTIYFDNRDKYKKKLYAFQSKLIKK